MTMSSNRLGPTFLAAINAIADAGLSPGDLRGAELTAFDELLNAMLENYPDEPLLLRFKGQVHFDRRKYDKAIPYFSRLVAIKPEDVDSASYLASSLFNCERYSEALPFLSTVLNAFPDDQELQFMKGYVLLLQNRREEAASLLVPLLREYNEDIINTYGKELVEIALMGLSASPPAPKGPPGPNP